MPLPLAKTTSGSESLMLNDQQLLILDGALATELEQKTNQTLDTPLWSAETLSAYPRLIKLVHLEYYLAGADVAITASYQASVQGLVQHRGITKDAAEQIIKQSVYVAADARTEASQQLERTTTHSPSTLKHHKRKLLIAGSIGPYGAYLSDGSEYTGAYNLPVESMKAFHRGRIKALVEAGADLLAIETQPNLSEIIALSELLRNEFPDTKAWITCTLRDDSATIPTMSDGSSLRALCEHVNSLPQIVGVGVNCCPKDSVTPALREMRRWTSKPLVAYPNSGELWDARCKTWREIQDGQKSWKEYTEEWVREGARMIGGCCRTSPQDILAIKNALT